MNLVSQKKVRISFLKYDKNDEVTILTILNIISNYEFGFPKKSKNFVPKVR